MRWSPLFLFVVLSGCNTSRIAELEKKTKDLEMKLNSSQQSSLLDLQSKCSSQADAEYKTQGWGNKGTSSYINHYNRRLNKCFLQVYVFGTVINRQLYGSTYVTDAFEGKTYGTYYGKSGQDEKPNLCTTTSLTGEDTFCHSEYEFKAAIKQYME